MLIKINSRFFSFRFVLCARVWNKYIYVFLLSYNNSSFTLNGIETVDWGDQMYLQWNQDKIRWICLRDFVFIFVFPKNFCEIRMMNFCNSVNSFNFSPWINLKEKLLRHFKLLMHLIFSTTISSITESKSGICPKKFWFARVYSVYSVVHFN